MSTRMISFLLVLLLLSAPALPARAEDSTAIRTPDDLLAVAEKLDVLLLKGKLLGRSRALRLLRERAYFATGKRD